MHVILGVPPPPSLPPGALSDQMLQRGGPPPPVFSQFLSTGGLCCHRTRCWGCVVRAETAWRLGHDPFHWDCKVPRVKWIRATAEAPVPEPPHPRGQWA